MKAVISAGGKGTRMGTGTATIPKPMLPIKGRPLLERQILFLRDSGIKDFYLTVSYLADVIFEYFGDGSNHGVSINYAYENTPLGTAGGIKQLEPVLTEDFLVVYGDLVFDLLIKELVRFHFSSNSEATLVLHPNDHPYDSDLVVLDRDQSIQSFYFKNEKPEFYPNLANAAFYILSPKIFQYIPDHSCDFVKDIFPKMLADKRRVFGYRTAEYIKDMGTPERWADVEQTVSSGRAERLNKRNSRPAIFFDRDGTLIEHVPLLHNADDLVVHPFTAETLKAVNNSDHLALLATNQPVVARNLCSYEDVVQIHYKLETLLGTEGAYLDDIFFCPHHPDKGYPEENKQYKIPCTCRKPGTGMIDTASEKYNIDRADSWYIGDTTVDIQTAANAGLRSVLVRTGKGGRDGKYPVRPDFIFPDAGEAVRFILEHHPKLKQICDNLIDSLDFDSETQIIAVAGQACAGKTTFTRVLLERLARREVSTCAMTLHCSCTADDHTAETEMRRRYHYDEVCRNLPGFIKIPGKSCPPFTLDTPPPEVGPDCMVIEGTPVLDIDILRESARTRIFVETDERTRYKRFTAHRPKQCPGISPEATHQYLLDNEFEMIQLSRRHANLIVST